MTAINIPKHAHVSALWVENGTYQDIIKLTSNAAHNILITFKYTHSGLKYAYGVSILLKGKLKS